MKIKKSVDKKLKTEIGEMKTFLLGLSTEIAICCYILGHIQRKKSLSNADIGGLNKVSDFVLFHGNTAMRAKANLVKDRVRDL